ncbi:MAG: glycosyltransferase family 8 protein [Leuconostoc fallax]
MNILYTLDSGFSKQLIVSVYSLIEHTQQDLRIFIVSDKIPQKYRIILKGFSNNERINIIYLDPPILPEKLIPDRGGKSQYYRMFIGQLFAKIDIKKIIYLDADTLITDDSIQTLENIDMQDSVLGACLDPWSKLYRKALGLKEGVQIFNSGVLVIDVQKWKLDNIDQKINNDIDEQKRFQQGDQGILNRVFENNFFVLSANFNVMDIYFSMNYEKIIAYRKAISFYKKHEIEDGKKHPIIVHFTSSYLQNRPWIKYSNNPYSDRWIEYYEKIMEEKLTLVAPKKTMLKIINDYLPQPISFKILSFLQSFVRPIIWITKER